MYLVRRGDFGKRQFFTLLKELVIGKNLDRPFFFCVLKYFDDRPRFGKTRSYTCDTYRRLQENGRFFLKIFDDSVTVIASGRLLRGISIIDPLESEPILQPSLFDSFRIEKVKFPVVNPTSIVYECSLEYFTNFLENRIEETLTPRAQSMIRDLLKYEGTKRRKWVAEMLNDIDWPVPNNFTTKMSDLHLEDHN